MTTFHRVYINNLGIAKSVPNKV
ncbi:hypothetical protein ENHY17A_110179 [Moraxellaceae bacterium 17A]|nr:hypothetical protein ENHY17A_110179 [Moraxellaceae bacterium 17A]